MRFHFPFHDVWPQLRRGRGAATKTTKSSTQAAPPGHRTTLTRQTEALLDLPPAYEDQRNIPYLQVGLPREDEIRVLRVVEWVMESLHVSLARRDYDQYSSMAVAFAIREGCISAAVAVCKTFEQRSARQLNDDMDEGCRKVADAVVRATAAAPMWNRMGVAETVVTCIVGSTDRVGEHRKDPLSFTATSQLHSTAQSVATTICVRILNGNDNPLHDIPFPPRAILLPLS
ncbi:hypothetical protein GQ53DRAFT_884407 [Thozetella sp. PMI_491]|nr:hypothetical protein GQ53DRAFT_884407 [Thozetella sp. PMI_491]